MEQASGNAAFERLSHLLADLDEPHPLVFKIVSDQPGTLADVLSRFAAAEVNLRAIQSVSLTKSFTSPNRFSCFSKMGHAVLNSRVRYMRFDPHPVCLYLRNTICAQPYPYGCELCDQNAFFDRGVGCGLSSQVRAKDGIIRFHLCLDRPAADPVITTVVDELTATGLIMLS